MTTTTDRQMVIFPTSQPEGTARAHIEPGRSLEAVPTWSIQTLNVGPTRSAPTYEQHLRDTVGSSYDWSDELRFDQRTGRLTSFVLKTPESGSIDPVIAKSWLVLPRQVGIPIIDDRENGFHVDPLDLRYVSEDASALVVTDAQMPSADSDSLRLAVSKDVDFLFYAGRYRGWSIRNPTAYLVTDPGDKPPCVDDPRLHGLLREYLTLVIEPHITQMSDEDPAMQRDLQVLRTRVQAIDGAQAATLRHAIERVLETFYPS